MLEINLNQPHMNKINILCAILMKMNDPRIQNEETNPLVIHKKMKSNAFDKIHQYFWTSIELCLHLRVDAQNLPKIHGT